MLLAQRKLWSDFSYFPKTQPSFRYLLRSKGSQHPRLPGKSRSNEQPISPNATNEVNAIPTTTDPKKSTWDIHQYPHLVNAIKRVAFAHSRLELCNSKVDSHLLAPLGVSSSSGELITLLERLGVYEANSNVYLLRANFVDQNVLTEFPTEIRYDDFNLLDNKKKKKKRVLTENREAYDPKLLSQVPDLDKKRKNLRTLPVYTIDSSSTVEIDDGLSLEYRGPEQTEWVLVHIADPTRWIVPNGPLDLAARKRVSTLYLPEVVQAMLPLEIARDVMSIIPSHLSHALTFAVRLDDDGSVLEYEIFPSLIQNIKRTTFDHVEAVLNSDQMAEPVLHRLYELALKRSAWRVKMGAFNTHLPKGDVELDSELNISLKFSCNTFSRAQLLVQEMMILTGQLAAAYATTFDIPVPYRSQEPPEVESEEYDQFLQTLPPIVREFEYVSVAKRATVSVTPSRHFGVGLDGYARSSSPIRRYHDMLVHHQIKAHLRGDSLPYSKEDMEKIVEETAPRDAIIHYLQKDSQRFWQLKYIEQHKDEVYTGLVLRVTEHAMEVLVMDVGLKCKVQIIDKNSGKFRRDKNKFRDDNNDEKEGKDSEKTKEGEESVSSERVVKRGEVIPLKVVEINPYNVSLEILTEEEIKEKEEAY